MQQTASELSQQLIVQYFHCVTSSFINTLEFIDWPPCCYLRYIKQVSIWCCFLPAVFKIITRSIHIVLEIIKTAAILERFKRFFPLMISIKIVCPKICGQISVEIYLTVWSLTEGSYTHTHARAQTELFSLSLHRKNYKVSTLELKDYKNSRHKSNSDPSRQVQLQTKLTALFTFKELLI